MDHTQPNPYPFGMGHGDYQTIAESAAKDAERSRKACQRIRQIIEHVDMRAMASEGAVPPTLQVMTQEEISEIYNLAKAGA